MLDIKTANGDVVTSQPIFPSTYLSLDGSNKETARKVTYYTPKFSGLQFGVSYIPDSGNLGSLQMKDSKSDSRTQPSLYNASNKLYTEPKVMKDVVTGGVSFEHHFNEDTSFKVAATGEYGKIAKDAQLLDLNSNVTTKYKMADLKSYNLGAIFTKGCYSIVGSVTDLDKTGTSKEVFGNNRKTKYYSAGAIYKNGPVGLSLSYYKSDKHKNKMDTFVFSTDYLLAPGLLPYAEIAWFNGKGALPSVYNDPTKRKYKGTVFLLGLGMSF
jgi:predicted porin